LGLRVWGLGFGAQGFGARQAAGLRVEGLGVWGLGFRVKGLGFRKGVLGFGEWQDAVVQHASQRPPEWSEGLRSPWALGSGSGDEGYKPKGSKLDEARMHGRDRGTSAWYGEMLAAWLRRRRCVHVWGSGIDRKEHLSVCLSVSLLARPPCGHSRRSVRLLAWLSCGMWPLVCLHLLGPMRPWLCKRLAAFLRPTYGCQIGTKRPN
jgi:hypothetical protein